MPRRKSWPDWEPGDPLPGSPEPLPGKCGAILKDSMNRYGAICRCISPAGWGTTHAGIGHCRKHGGNTPNQKKAAGKEIARREVMSLSERLGKPIPLDDPIQALLDVAAEFLEFRTILRELLDNVERIDVTDVQGVSRVHALVTAYQEAMRDSERVLATVQRLDLGRRKMELDEQMAELVSSVMLAVILDARLALPDEKIDLARLLLSEKLLELAPKSESDVIDVEEIE